MIFLQFFLPGGVIGFYFAFCAVIDGVEYKTGMGINKKEARLKAAQLAVEELLSNLENDTVLPDASGKHYLVLWIISLPGNSVSSVCKFLQ